VLRWCSDLLPPFERTRLVGRGLVLLLAGGLCSCPLAAEPAAAKTPGKAWSVRWEPLRLVNGAALVFRVAAPPGLKSLSGSWLGHEVFFTRDAPGKTWYGIAGVSLETAAGSYSLQLTGTARSGKEISFERKLRIRREKYPSIAVTVPPKFTEPSPDELQRINQEKTVKQEVFAHSAAQREWSGEFLPPVNARISDVFGTRRTFNGETRSTHQGLDYAVPPGTPVSALNRGTVLLARPLFFEGNCVVLDHGQGLLTLYMHLSELAVKEGETVTRGQRIALSGGSGRATGPHLHVAVRWQGVYLNPATLLRLKLP